MIKRSAILALVALVWLLCAGAPVRAQDSLPYRLTVFDEVAGIPVINAVAIDRAGNVAADLLPPGGPDQAAFQFNGTWLPLGVGRIAGLNDLGQAVGHSPAGPTLWDGLQSSPLTGLAYAASINNAGQVAGGVVNAQGDFAAIWQAGNITLLGPGGAEGMNEAGHVAGWSNGGILWDASGRTLLSAPDGPVLFDANLQGQAVGLRLVEGQGWVAHQWDRERSFDLLAADGGWAVVAYDINNLGQSVGLAGSRAMLWQDGAATDLNSLLRPGSVEAGWVLERANAINDSGWIVGMAYNRFDCQSWAACEWHGFLLSKSDLPDELPGSVTPIPEPGTLALMAAGLAMLASMKQRRHAARASLS